MEIAIHPHYIIRFLILRIKAVDTALHSMLNSMRNILNFEGPHIKSSINSWIGVEICGVVGWADPLLDQIFNKVACY